MALVSPHLHCIRLDTNATYATSAAGDIISWSIDRALDAPARLRFEIALGTFAALLVAATGGPALTSAIIPLLCEFSEDGGSTVDVRFVLTSCQRSMDAAGPKLIIEQDDMTALYGVTGVDRVTFIGAKPQDVLYGAPGTIPRPAGHLGAIKAWPYVKGLFRTVPGMGRWAGQSLLAMTPVLDPVLAAQPLSVDVYADTIQNALKTISTRLAGSWISSDTAPYGSRGHWVPHTGDAALSRTGIARSLSVGRVDKTSRVTFDGDTTGLWDETTTARIAGAVTVDPALADLYLQASMIGGASDHGISTGQGTSGSAATQITSVVAINTGRGDASTRWDDCLPVVGTTAGVYYYPHCGFLVPCSQPLVVNALAYDGTTVYAATNTGVYALPAGQIGAGVEGAKGDVSGGVAVTAGIVQWPLLGGLSAPVADVWLDGVNVLARCGGETKKNGVGIDGVYCYPAVSGDTNGANQGYAGWSRIQHSGSPLAAGGTAANLYYADKNKPGTVYLIGPGTSTQPRAVTGIAAGQQVVGIDTGRNLDGTPNGYVYIRTDAGNAGLYAVVVGSTTALAASGGMASNDGAPVTVRRIAGYGAALSGGYVALLAATDAGLYASANPAGGPWTAPNAASGLGDFDMAGVAGAAAQTVLGRTLTRLYAWADSALLISHNSGDTWSELLGEKLDCGPFWYALAQQCGAMPWPDNTIGALGTVAGAAQAGNGPVASIVQVKQIGQLITGSISPAGSTDTGGTGAVLPIPASNSRALPAGWIWARRLDEQCRFTYRLVNLNGTAPMAGMQFHELPEIQAGADVGAVTASEQVALVTWRWLAAASIPRLPMTIPSSYTQSNAKLRDLAPQDLVTVHYNPADYPGILAFSGTRYVLRHTRNGTSGYVSTTTVVDASLESANQDPNAEAAAQQDRLSKKLRFGSA